MVGLILIPTRDLWILWQEAQLSVLLWHLLIPILRVHTRLTVLDFSAWKRFLDEGIGGEEDFRMRHVNWKIPR
ncbi:hypothetical protein FPQ18DRAFT_342249 [Pyronema domesticum]|nr:hypothetical protein FPQ18DRAFT_342249 [Pyronema domesticum]